MCDTQGLGEGVLTLDSNLDMGCHKDFHMDFGEDFFASLALENWEKAAVRTVLSQHLLQGHQMCPVISNTLCTIPQALQYHQG